MYSAGTQLIGCTELHHHIPTYVIQIFKSFMLLWTVTYLYSSTSESQSDKAFLFRDVSDSEVIQHSSAALWLCDVLIRLNEAVCFKGDVSG